MADYQYFEDFTVGDTLETEAITLTEAEIIAFASQFDPQPMHTDPEAAKALTGGLIASGWHTASLTMRMMITAPGRQSAPGTLGMGVAELKWFKPVRPGDSIRLKLLVTAVRASETKPDRGIVTKRFTTLNQHGEPVEEMVSSAMVPKRNAGG